MTTAESDWFAERESRRHLAGQQRRVAGLWLWELFDDPRLDAVDGEARRLSDDGGDQ